VAVFRYDGQVSALSNVCQHQNGPLGEGRILDGCVTCPWHGYQYRPEDGASPPPFRERVPTFRVRVEGGRILVDPRPLPAGTRVEPATFDPATPAPADREAFFVGYRPVQRQSKDFLSRTVGSIAVLVVAVAASLAASQRPLGSGEYEYGVESKLAGLLRAAPVPLLWTSSSLARSGDANAAVVADGFRAVPLVGQGKHGVSSDVLALAGQEVRLSGSWIRRGNVALFEVARAEPLRSPSPPPPPAGDTAALPLGRQRLVGEVVDSKCYLGVMKPGSGKGHHDCAVRCISGGAPAALVAQASDGTTWVLLLVAPSGRPLGPELLDRVAEPVEVTGEVTRLGSLALLVAEPASFLRLGENPPR
jgi:nitrite reductase/ring-hydroxylating ferredoxin subunit